MFDKYREKSWLIGVFVILLVIVATIVVATAYHLHNSYPIESDMSNLESNILALHQRGRSDDYTCVLKLYDAVSLGNKEFIWLELNGFLGNVVLRRSITGRYKIDVLGCVDGSLITGVVENEGKKYLLFGGKNTELDIAKATFTIEELTYSIDIPQQTRYFVCTEVDSQVEGYKLDRNNLKFFDAKGNDITAQCDLSGGDIAFWDF